MDRRTWLKTAALAGATTFASQRSISAEPLVEPDYRIVSGKIHQTIMGWTFDPMPTLELARQCKAIGLVAMEGISARTNELWVFSVPLLKNLKLSQAS